MKVLYFLPRYAPALMGNRIHAEVVEAWRARGVIAEVLALDASVSRLTTAVYDGITVHQLPVSSSRLLKAANRVLGALLHYPYLAGALLHYRRFLATHHYDLVHVETAFPLGLVAALVPRQSHPPLAVTLPGADIMAEPEFDYGYARFMAVRSLLPFVFRRADTLRADSPQIHELAVRLGAAPSKVTAIPYNITEDSFPPAGTDLHELRARARAEVIARHNLDPARPIVVSLSRLHPFKGVDYLVEAIPLVRAAGVSAQVLVVGPSRSTPRFGDYGTYLQRRATELGVADSVILTGGVPHEQTLGYLAAADAVVVPSVAESFNRVAVEAAAVGTPVVVTRTTGVSDYVAAEDCGLVVEPRNGPSIGQALAKLLSDRTLWNRLSANGPAMANGFRSHKIADDLLKLYRPWLEK